MTQGFTDDHQKLSKALLGIVPHSLTAQNFHDCPDVSYYQADLIVNKSDPQALAVATQEALDCAFNGDTRMTTAAQSMAQGAANRMIVQGGQRDTIRLPASGGCRKTPGKHARSTRARSSIAGLPHHDSAVRSIRYG